MITGKDFFNLSQNLLEAISHPPLLCHARYLKPNSFCDGCEPGDVFRCGMCDRLMPWCMGAADIFFDWCDDCVAFYSEMEGFPEEGE